MTHVVNTAITDALTFLDTAGELVTGKVNGDFTKTAYLTSTPATTATVTVTTDSAITGEYPISFTPTAVGRWKAKVSCTHNGHTYRWEEVYDVITAAQADPAAHITNGTSLSTPVPGNFAQGTAGYALGRIGAGAIDVQAPVWYNRSIDIVSGDDYKAVDGRAIDFVQRDVDDWPDLTDATIAFTAAEPRQPVRLTKTGTIIEASTFPKRVRIEIDGADTVNLKASHPATVYVYFLRATLTNGNSVTLARSELRMLPPA